MYVSATCDEIEIPKIECSHVRMTMGKKKKPYHSKTRAKNHAIKECKHSTNKNTMHHRDSSRIPGNHSPHSYSTPLPFANDPSTAPNSRSSSCSGSGATTV